MTKNYKCDESKEWYDWESHWWDEYKLRKHADDLAELRWQEYERRRMETESRLCGYEPEMEDDYDYSS